MTEIELMLALYHNPRTREVSLEMADKNRLAAATAPLNLARKAETDAQDHTRR